ncbi:NAD(P)/FAD-dependent oxidoreductase [Microbacterium thalassium]|uniref:3-phenylpropionate/trans-cinnamate dioxygenase ferredoxin reductase subunit n=1 Tax=Microbacterium thalassium TaxID=362649 RepID=A0A7X0KTB5_9MICO|nr:NAD(P)/FAD-dependent oxidoreductase [Microbacterium thalassium]MBB6389956.1 3-phenylpropionate/trans-cinnamate dioxygenase ferredoxin reductase subunit [Microbacterium thalassium]GLK24642.1 oxidoreductase [Microbacterium thalassium]
MTEQLVVVGASVATTAFLERMRELGDRRSIIVVDGDPDAPYDRPPLSKHFLVEGDAEDIAVDWSDLDATLVRGWATGVDVEARMLLVREAGGEELRLPYGQLVIATGASPIRLPIEPADTLALRSAEDARRLRAGTGDAERTVIIGAGAIGVELASSLAARGGQAVLVDRAQGPLERLLAGHLANEVTQWLEDAGVECVWGADIAAITRTDAGWRVDMGDGSQVAGDVLVSAVGARPAVGWLAGTGLLTDGMLLADEDGRVVTAEGAVPDVYAIGDVVSRRDAGGSTTRTESWAAARQHGARLAEDLCGADREQEPRPYFWTEVAGRKLQVVGSLDPAMTLQVEFENPERGTVLYRAEDDSTAWIGINAQPRIARLLMGV